VVLDALPIVLALLQRLHDQHFALGDATAGCALTPAVAAQAGLALGTLGRCLPARALLWQIAAWLPLYPSAARLSEWLVAEFG